MVGKKGMICDKAAAPLFYAVVVIECLHGGVEVDYGTDASAGFGDDFGFLFPISHPHPLRVLTTFGVTAAVRGTLMKMKDL